MPASVTVAAPSLNRRVAGQGALLLGGVVAGQLFAFARHAVLAYGLARGAFGTAMAILLTLQLIEALTDLAPERLILQADDGPTAKLISVGHTVAILRGIAGAALLYCATDWIAAFFSIPDAAPAFAMMALVPLIKGLQHLDQRRAQRRLDNGPAMLVELVPAVLGLALAWPLVRLLGSYDVIVWLFIGQALAQVAVSHAIAREPYRVARDPETLRRYLAFGWPMIAAALPHAATYHGERAIIGRFLGMEALAGYTAGFLLTSAAGLIAARLGQALVLPLLSAARTDPVVFKNRFIRLHELHVIAAAVLATGAIVGGNAVLRVAFGKQYWSYGGVLAWLAVLTAIRIVQSPAALALMAHGETRIGLIATLVRAAAVGPIVLAAMAGATLESIIAIGVAGEAMSMLVYVIGLSRWIGRDIIGQTLARSAWLVAMLTIAWTMPAMPGTIAGLALTGTLALAVVAIGVLVMPQARETTRQGLGSLG